MFDYGTEYDYDRCTLHRHFWCFELLFVDANCSSIQLYSTRHWVLTTEREFL